MQSWQETMDMSNHNVMNKLLIKKFKQSDDYIERNETLKLIKSSKPKSITSVYNQIMDSKSYNKQSYFDYIRNDIETDVVDLDKVVSSSIDSISINDEEVGTSKRQVTINIYYKIN